LQRNLFEVIDYVPLSLGEGLGVRPREVSGEAGEARA